MTGGGSKMARWSVSAMALAYRLHDLDLLTDWEYHRACVDLAREGYRSSEPGGMPRESSRLLRYVLGHLTKSADGVERLLGDLAMTRADLNELVFGLVPTTVESAPDGSPRRRGHLRAVP